MEPITPRMNFPKVVPEAYKILATLEAYLHHSGLELRLLHLMKLRASQINGCAYCIDMHWKDLRALGETEQRLYGLDAWREAPYYTDRERAALEWAEELTLISQTHARDEVFERVKKQFTEKELVDLTLVIASINTWNRLAIGFRSEPGPYVSRLKEDRGQRLV